MRMTTCFGTAAGSRATRNGGPRRAARHASLAAVAALAAACQTMIPPPSTPAATPAPAAADSARTAADSARPTAAFPTERPALGPAPTVTLPPVARRALPNGMTLLVVEQHELPVADFVLVVGTGAEADPTGKAGAATLMADLLTEGTSTRSALEIADQTAFLGVQLDATSGWDVTTVSLHTPTAQLDSALALFADVVLRPSFPAAELERRRQERLTGLLQLKDRAPAIADRAFATTLYGAGHAYGRALTGTEGSTRSITRADLQRLYRSYVRPGNADARGGGRRAPRRRGGARAAAVRRVAGRGGDGPPRLGTPPARARRRSTWWTSPAPRSRRSASARWGWRARPEDYFPLLVMNTILGGSFTSRLNQNLRETRGYTYGAQSAFSMRRTAGPVPGAGRGGHRPRPTPRCSSS
jgi:hypothetical protein